MLGSHPSRYRKADQRHGHERGQRTDDMSRATAAESSAMHLGGSVGSERPRPGQASTDDHRAQPDRSSSGREIALSGANTRRPVSQQQPGGEEVDGLRPSPAATSKLANRLTFRVIAASRATYGAEPSNKDRCSSGATRQRIGLPHEHHRRCRAPTSASWSRVQSAGRGPMTSIVERDGSVELSGRATTFRWWVGRHI